MQEAELVREAQQGNKAAVELLITQTYPAVLRFVRFKVGQDALSWDISQIVYEKAWGKLHLFDAGRGRILPWLLTIAHHTLLDYFRSKAGKEQGREQPLDVELVSHEDVVDSLIFQEDVRRVLRAMQDLPVEQRDALFLRFKQELSMEEVAQAMQCPLSTAKSRVQMGLAKLKKLLGDEDVPKQGRRKQRGK